MDIRELNPFDDDGLRRWYDVYRAALTAGREYHSAYSFEEVRAALRNAPPSLRHRPLLALAGGELVGVVGSWIPLLENRRMFQLEVAVRPDRWGQGIGGTLLAAAERLAREEGRTVLVGEAAYPFDAPADGSGTRAVEFARRHGFQFGLGDVQRVLDLPAPQDLLDELAARAAERHEGYRFRQFSGLAPEELLPDVAELRAAVETEAPTGDMDRERGVVDLDAVRADEAALAAQGRTRFTTVALAPDGTMAGYTDLVVPEFDPQWIYQWGTLVWGAHRGHRLGLALKARNAAWVQQVFPERHAIRTWNAEANVHMVAINEAMGFRPVERLGEFQKRLA
ncbi:MAG TPA: GNAT family N-acetyltransferase [Marmoricola sp.]|nr:GNAT family N-acetyltransferase [Marmoricola sp.]